MPKRAAKKLPTFLAVHEPEALLRATKRERDRILGMVLLYLGLRVSEACRLQIEDIDFTGGFVMVRQGKGSKDRALPLPRRLAGPLRGFLGSRTTGPVFPSPYGGCLKPRGVQLLVKRLALAAGLKDAAKPRKVTPHKLRHAFASRMLERGATIAEVRDALGHSSVAVTDIYTHSRPEALRKAMEV